MKKIITLLILITNLICYAEDKPLTDSENTLLFAVKKGNEQLVQTLIKNGVSVKIKDDKGSLLHSAVYFDNDSMFKLLLNEGADINATDKTGMTPFMLAVYLDREIITDFIITKKELLNINQKNNDGETVFSIAVKKRNMELLKEILKLNPDINTVNNEGDTPLMAAVKKNYTEIAVFLLDNKADPTIKDKVGNDVIGIASFYENFDVLDMLLTPENVEKARKMEYVIH